MQLIAISRFRISSSVFNPSLSAVLSGMTAVGAISAAIYHLESAKSAISTSLSSLLDTEATKYLLSGLSKVGETFYNWGSLIVGSKDAFKQWLSSYFNASGLKAGTVKLYEKLRDWTLIVYKWFRYSFLEFINNIPKMVKDWDKLRLSLFKWGTFLGGGGGSALWAMFGSGANLAELGELMSNPKFGEMLERFGELFNDNKEAFDELGADGIQEILEEYLKDPEKADEAAKALIKKQEEKKEKAKAAEEKDEEKPSDKLTKEEIMEEFKPSQAGGNPPDKKAVLSRMINNSLEEILKNSSVFSFDASYASRAKKILNDYLGKIEEDIKNSPKRSKIKQEFFDIVKSSKEAFVNGIAQAVEQAFQGFEEPKNGGAKSKKEENLKKLRQRFINALTKPCQDNKCDAAPLVESLTGK